MSFFYEEMRVDFLEILEDYKKYFCNKMCCIETDFKNMEFINVYFSENDLCHLLGFHKILNKNASRIIKDIKNQKLKINDIKKHNNYNLIKNRIGNYNFIHEIFYKKSVNLCIVDKDIISNTMKLNIIIYKDKGHEVIVLGLKKSIKTNIYYLATLHKTYENKYKHFRKTKIKNIFWIE